MSRTRKLTDKFYLSLPPLYTSLLRYYAEKRLGTDPAEAMRHLLDLVVRADQDFDVEDFKKYVQRDILKHYYEDDDELRDDLKRRLKAFAESF